MGRSEMFASVAGSRGGSALGGAAPTSIVLHGAALGLLLAVAPLASTTTAPKAARDHVGILTYDPPPPPAAALPRGDGPVPRVAARTHVRPETVPAFVEPAAVQPPIQSTAESVPEVLAGGSPHGIDEGTAEGEEYGRKGGVAGGVPDGIEGGIVTGTGRFPVPVTGYQRAPVRLRMVQPVYPPEAFAQKVQGTVVLQILIGVDGRVLRATVTHGIPQLDAAAVEAVLQWRFRPARKDGEPVPSLATAPVQFKIH